jgi:hypothetical protein
MNRLLSVEIREINVFYLLFYLFIYYVKFNKTNFSIFFTVQATSIYFTTTIMIFLLKSTTFAGICINDRLKNGSITVQIPPLGTCSVFCVSTSPSPLWSSSTGSGPTRSVCSLLYIVPPLLSTMHCFGSGMIYSGIETDHCRRESGSDPKTGLMKEIFPIVLHFPVAI